MRNNDAQPGTQIGDVVWFKGDAYTVTRAPFILHGGWFIEATDAAGRKVTVATRAQASKDADAARSAFLAQQAEFRKLNE